MRNLGKRKTIPEVTTDLGFLDNLPRRSVQHFARMAGVRSKRNGKRRRSHADEPERARPAPPLADGETREQRMRKRDEARKQQLEKEKQKAEGRGVARADTKHAGTSGSSKGPDLRSKKVERKSKSKGRNKSFDFNPRSHPPLPQQWVGMSERSIINQRFIDELQKHLGARIKAHPGTKVELTFDDDGLATPANVPSLDSSGSGGPDTPTQDSGQDSRSATTPSRHSSRHLSWTHRSGSQDVPPEEEEVDHWWIKRYNPLGEGSQGKVLQAVRPGVGATQNRFVAVKQVSHKVIVKCPFWVKIDNVDQQQYWPVQQPQPRVMLDNAKREIKTLSKMNNKYIVDYVAHTITKDETLLFMEMMDGSLESITWYGCNTKFDVYRKSESWPARAGLLWDAWVQMLHALTYVHEQGMVHLDFHFGNVLYRSRDLSKGRTKYRFKLADFGLAKPTGTAAINCGMVWVAPPELYGSILSKPEIPGWDAKYSPSIDAYSAFVTFHRAMKFPDPYIKNGIKMGEDSLIALYGHTDQHVFITGDPSQGVPDRSQPDLFVRTAFVNANDPTRWVEDPDPQHHGLALRRNFYEHELAEISLMPDDYPLKPFASMANSSPGNRMTADIALAMIEGDKDGPGGPAFDPETFNAALWRPQGPPPFSYWDPLPKAPDCPKHPKDGVHHRGNLGGGTLEGPTTPPGPRINQVQRGSPRGKMGSPWRHYMPRPNLRWRLGYNHSPEFEADWRETLGDAPLVARYNAEALAIEHDWHSEFQRMWGELGRPTDEQWMTQFITNLFWDFAYHYWHFVEFGKFPDWREFPEHWPHLNNVEPFPFSAMLPEDTAIVNLVVYYNQYREYFDQQSNGPQPLDDSLDPPEAMSDLTSAPANTFSPSYG